MNSFWNLELMLQKVEDKRRLAQKIQQRLKESPEVRPFPAAVARFTAASHDPNADAQEFATIIECDPALSSKILQMANSPLFCPNGEVKNIAHAVSLLGLRRIKSLAMSVAGAEMFASGSENAHEERQKLWRHSLGCATVARALTKYIPGVDKDQAFLAGVFHDIGKLRFLDAIPEEYVEIHSAYTGLRLLEEEQFLIGITHERIGYLSAISWNLPEEIRIAIGWHHRPDEAEAFADFAGVIHLANCLAACWCVGSEVQIVDESLESRLKHYGLTVEQLEATEAEARSTFEETVGL